MTDITSFRITLPDDLPRVVLSKGTLENPVIVESAMPIGATYSVTYATADTGIATITPGGKITPVSEGAFTVVGTDSITGITSEREFKVVVPNTSLDGLLRPIVVACTGDSLIDGGSSNSSTGILPTNKYLSVLQHAAWVSTFHLFADSDYIVRPDTGKSGAGSSDILARLPGLLEGDADLIVIQACINDSTAQVQLSKDNYLAMLNLVTESGKSALVLPIPMRNDYSDPSSSNAKNVEINQYVRDLAATMPNVEVAPDQVAYNAKMLENKSFGGVSDDGLHPNNVGGIMQGKINAEFVDSKFPSRIRKTNVLPDHFEGTGGVAKTGSVGVMPDGITSYYGDGVEGPIDRGDGRVWWKIKSGGAGEVLYRNYTKILYDPISTDGGKYTGELTMVFVNAPLLTKVRLYAKPSPDTKYTYTDINSYKTCLNAFESGVEYKFRTPTTYVSDNNDGIQIGLETEQALGDDVEIYITDGKAYKVEEYEFGVSVTKKIATFIVPDDNTKTIEYGDGLTGFSGSHEYAFHGEYTASYGNQKVKLNVTPVSMPDPIASTAYNEAVGKLTITVSGLSSYIVTINGKVFPQGEVETSAAIGDIIEFEISGVDFLGNTGRYSSHGSNIIKTKIKDTAVVAYPAGIVGVITNVINLTEVVWNTDDLRWVDTDYVFQGER